MACTLTSANRRQSSRLLFLLVLGAVAACVCWTSAVSSFVQGPATHAGARQLARRVMSATPQSASAAAPAAAAPSAAETAPAAAAAPGESQPPKKDEEKEIDDAVLKMAMAMAEEEEAAPAKPAAEEGFDWNILVSGFWIFLIIYSFGSVIIGVTQGRIQDRTGGDFTAYDFFDNIFSFKEWDIEYTLGFNPVKVFEEAKSKIGL